MLASLAALALLCCIAADAGEDANELLSSFGSVVDGRWRHKSTMAP